ncbi:unnamed protein product [Effrenium voratum]|uniref:Palmitoyltransferase n=1 Tax=Effrenium voratum TaxID=2562239 RepID=A0AA36IYW1_9DINO|nr:unnamed protein product [Effrenium voratum]CAJ1417475.1 unnamed protein product [Effrenium voratum]
MSSDSLLDSELEPFQHCDMLPSLEDLDSWEQLWPLESLPPLPKRDPKYWSQATVGMLLIASMIVSLTVAVHLSVGRRSRWSNPSWCESADTVIQGFALLALFCTAFILCGRSGEVKRSRLTCYPIPAQVVHHLQGQLPRLDKNIDGPEHSTRLRSYCVRCLVWRTRGCESSHHCSICQRCVPEFDHHCGVLGRCISEANMPCFKATLGAGLAGLIALVLTNGWCSDG